MTRYRVVITDSNLGDGSHERAELGAGFDVTKHDVAIESDVVAVAAHADGLLVQWAPITADVLDRLPRLRAVVRYGIGLDNIDLAAAEQRGVLVGNVDDYCIEEVADHAVAAIYAHNRRLTVAARAVPAQGWTAQGIPTPIPPPDDPVGIVGFGRIGRAVAERLRALGFPVHVWDPYVADVPSWVTSWPALRDLAAACNHLTVHLPLSDATRRLLDADVLTALGPCGHLVNTARGPLVDEPELRRLLDAGELGFATLDVLGSEPPQGVSAAIAAHERVLATPHIAYLSTSSLPALRIGAARKLGRLLQESCRS